MKRQTAQGRIVTAGIVAGGGVFLLLIVAILIGSLAVVTGITGIMALVVLGIAALILMRVEEVHLLVNSRLTAVIDRVEQLTDSLQEAGVAVPPPHSLDQASILSAQHMQTLINREHSNNPSKVEGSGRN